MLGKLHLLTAAIFLFVEKTLFSIKIFWQTPRASSFHDITRKAYDVNYVSEILAVVHFRDSNNRKIFALSQC